MSNFLEKTSNDGGRLDSRMQTGLEQQQEKWRAELSEVEEEIHRVEALQETVTFLETFEKTPETTEAITTAIDAIRTLEASQNLASLLARRRQLKQLIETGKIALDDV